MCLIGLRLSSEPLLLIAANRDEFHDRAAQPAHWWPGGEIYAGRDLAGGGTWLGVSSGGRFATVTNVREMQRSEAPRSRGDLPLAFLRSRDSAAEFCAALGPRGQDYGGFNLLAWDGEELWWCSNRGPGPLRVSEGIHALSNHHLDTPWPKVRWIREALGRLPDEAPLAQVIEILGNDEVPDGALPDTGVGPELERMLAPAFIRGGQYGTRCSTALAIGPSGFEMLEVSYERDGEPGAVRHERSGV